MTDVRMRDRVVIRFAGDSGDGMQLTGDRFTSDSVFVGNDFATLPLYLQTPDRCLLRPVPVGPESAGNRRTADALAL